MLYPDFKELLELGYRSSGISLTSRKKSRSAVSGDYRSPFRGRGLEFEEVRRYVHGDEVRSIDWRVTARTGVPHLKLFSEDRERSVFICTDVNKTMRFGTRGTFKSIQAARVASFLGWASVRENNATGASFFGNVPNGMRFFGARRSRRSLWRMLKQLCDKQDYHNAPVPLDEHLRHLAKAVPSGSLVFVISDFLSPCRELRKALANLQRRSDVILISVNDPADAHLPQVGPLIFEGQNRERLLIDTNDIKGVKSYERKWHENRRSLEIMTGTLGIGLIYIYTNKDAASDLAMGLQRIRQKGGQVGSAATITASSAASLAN